jgi:hypothetical protein
MTDISVHVQQLRPENLSWDLTPDEHQAYVEGGTLDVAAFTQADHYPNGFIPSGIVLALNPAGHLAPYLNSAVDSTNVAVGILRASIQVIRPDGSTKGLIGAAVMKAFGVVSESKLPIANTVTTGGYIDATGKTDLAHIHFAA